MLLDARHRHRRQEDSVRNLGQPLGLSADADEGFDVVVPGGDVRVADGPVDAVAVPGVGLEVEVAQPVALPRPHDRAASHLAPPDPQEGLLRVAGVGMLVVVDEELARHFVARVALALDGLVGGQRLAVVPAPVGHFGRAGVFGVVPFGHDRGPGFEDEDGRAQLGELLGRPSPGHPRADDDGVVFLAARADVHGPRSAAVSGAQPSKAGKVVR